jgi:FkbM family methyltransferase
MRNLALSELSDRVTVFGCALSDEPRVLTFNYHSLASGSSGSQLGHRRVAGQSRDFVAAASETLFATSVDRLIADAVIAAPTLVKIDVDGNELQILHGMRALLGGSPRPRSVQVELNEGEQAAIVGFFESCGYRLVERHLTAIGKQRVARGAKIEDIAHNAIFEPGEAA